MKRVLTCLLAFVLMLSMLPVQVMAADETVSAALVLENSGLKTADGRAMYMLHFRLFGSQLGNVAAAFIAVDSNVFDLGMMNGDVPTVSPLVVGTTDTALTSGHYQFRSADLWDNGYVDGSTGASAVSLGSDGKYYIRMEMDKGWDMPLTYTDYSEVSYTTAAPSIGTVYLILKAGQTASAGAVGLITPEQAAAFHAPAAIFACNKAGEFFLYNAAAGVSGNVIMDVSVTLAALAGKLEVTTESGYSIDAETGYLLGVAEQTTMETLLSKFTNPLNTMKVFDKNGSEITDTAAMLGTGTVIKLMNGDAVVQEITVIVKGDVTGDAVIDANDVTLLFKSVLKLETLDGAFANAGLLVNTDESNASDVTKLFRYILKLENEL